MSQSPEIKLMPVFIVRLPKGMTRESCRTEYPDQVKIIEYGESGWIKQPGEIAVPITRTVTLGPDETTENL